MNSIVNHLFTSEALVYELEELQMISTESSIVILVHDRKADVVKAVRREVQRTSQDKAQVSKQ